jgi:hypothetical protein
MRRREFITLLGGAATWPTALHSQQTSRASRIGFLGVSTPSGVEARLQRFRAGLRDLGYVEGQSIFIDFRWADALREELRKRDYLPILFDFEKPRSRDTDETITLLVRMARFIIADISDAKSVLQELRAIVPDLPSVPVQPIILAMQEEPGMFDHYRSFRSFLTAHRYTSQEQLLADLSEKVIRPAELKVRELRGLTSS